VRGDETDDDDARTLKGRRGGHKKGTSNIAARSNIRVREEEITAAPVMVGGRELRRRRPVSYNYDIPGRDLVDDSHSLGFHGHHGNPTPRNGNVGSRKMMPDSAKESRARARANGR
jgi:hypothetical protein